MYIFQKIMSFFVTSILSYLLIYAIYSISEIYGYFEIRYENMLYGNRL